jgi:predicted nucleic acid-binding protein
MKSVVYDTGVLIGADRNERQVWAEHRVRLEAGIVPIVPAPVVAQASRSPKQAQMRRFLRGCEIVPLDEELAHRVGSLLGKSRTRDIVDASVVALAVAHSADILSDDEQDIRRLVTAARGSAKIRDI